MGLVLNFKGSKETFAKGFSSPAQSEAGLRVRSEPWDLPRPKRVLLLVVRLDRLGSTDTVAQFVPAFRKQLVVSYYSTLLREVLALAVTARQISCDMVAQVLANYTTGILVCTFQSEWLTG